MALRIVEALVPAGADVHAALAETPVIDVWTVSRDDARDTVRILLDSGNTEAVSDGLTREFGHHDRFRLVLLPVEATIPVVTSPDPEPSGPEGVEAAPVAMPLGRISREELYEDVAQAAKLTPVFLITVVLSTVVAAVGLIRGDVAILIGAMVIAPLLGPNIALALACTLGDLDLARKSLRAIAAGVATAFTLSLLLGLVLQIEPSSPELARRTAAGLEDIALALAAGTAGALAFTTGVPTVVVGVMVAVALLPPLVVTGLLVGSGNFHFAFSAFILVVANVTCLNLAAVATFLLQKVRPRTWWESERAARATRLAVTTWVVMLVILALLIVLRQQRIA